MEFGDQGGPVVVETVDPPVRFSFRWNHPREEEQAVGNSMLVEFTLTPEGYERTLLRVTESGRELLGWPDAEKERYCQRHQEGWGGSSTASPRWPRSTRWDAPQIDEQLGRPSPFRRARQVLDLLVSNGEEAPAGWPDGCRSPARPTPSTWSCSKGRG